MMRAFAWPQLAYSSWYQRWSLVGFLPYAIGVGGLVAWLAAFKHRKLSRIPLVGLFLVSLVMLGFVSLIFPPGARQVFDFLTLHVPGWVGEKNFYETFAIPYVISVALLCSVGFYALSKYLSRSTSLALGLVVVVLVGIYGSPVLLGNPFRSPYYNGSPANRVLATLPAGYTAAVSRISRFGDAPTLSLPLLEPAWTYLVGQGSNERTSTYIGIPPLYYLYGVPDYTGISSFQSSVAPNLSTILQNALSTGDAESFSRVIGLLGVHWVLSDLAVTRQVDFQTVNSQATPATSASFSGAVEQDLEARLVLQVGRYRLSRVPPASTTPLISIDRATGFSRSSQGISQVAAGFYRGPLRRACPHVTGGNSLDAKVKIVALVTEHVGSGSCFVALRDPYSTLWSATLSENGVTIALRHREVYGFANGFVLPALTPGRVDITFTNSSSSYDELGVGLTLSSIAILIGGPFIVGFVVRRRRRRASRIEPE
jgi:hypothetical protein